MVLPRGLPTCLKRAKKLKARQSDGLRAVPGCIEMAPVDDLRVDSDVHAHKNNCHMIATQELKGIDSSHVVKH